LVTRPRGLCDSCFRDPGVRVLFPSNDTRQSPEDTDYADRPPPPEPTDCPPGSAGKVDAMAARVAAGVGLWHPDDARGE